MSEEIVKTESATPAVVENRNTEEKPVDAARPADTRPTDRPRFERKPFNRDGGDRKKFFRRKVCFFCKNKIDVVDYKDVKSLRRYVKESGKIIPKRLTGTCSKHQRMVTRSIKRSRNIALLPYETKY